MKMIYALVLLLILAVQPAWAKESKVLEGSVNINTASMEELMLLPGIGEVKAKQIVDARQAKPFAKKEDLLAISGIGEKLLAKMSSYIVFDGKSSLKETNGGAIPAPTTAKP